MALDANQLVERVLDQLRHIDAMQTGHFSYTKDYHSDFHIDCRRFMQWPQNVQDVARHLQQAVSEELQIGQIDYVVTANRRAGLLLAYELAQGLNLPLVGFSRISDDVVAPPNDFQFSGKALMVDDGLNTGNTFHEILKMAPRIGLKVAGAAVFLNRLPVNADNYPDAPVVAYADISDHYPIWHRDQCDLCTSSQNLIGKKNQKSGAKGALISSDVAVRLELRNAYELA